MLKSYQQYVFELNKSYEYLVKIAGTNPKGEVMERIKHALDVYCVETVTTPKSVPIQEHREFPKLGPVECWVFEVAVSYPTTPEQLRQLIKERAAINPDCVCVWPKDQYNFNEEFEAHGHDHDGSLLEQPELAADAGGQELVGQARRDSLLKELTARTYDYEGKDYTIGGDKQPSYNKNTNEIPTSNTSPVGTKQNKIPTPPKGSVR